MTRNTCYFRLSNIKTKFNILVDNMFLFLIQYLTLFEIFFRDINSHFKVIAVQFVLRRTVLVCLVSVDTYFKL